MSGHFISRTTIPRVENYVATQFFSVVYEMTHICNSKRQDLNYELLKWVLTGRYVHQIYEVTETLSSLTMTHRRHSKR